VCFLSNRIENHLVVACDMCVKYLTLVRDATKGWAGPAAGRELRHLVSIAASESVRNRCVRTLRDRGRVAVLVLTGRTP